MFVVSKSSPFNKAIHPNVQIPKTKYHTKSNATTPSFKHLPVQKSPQIKFSPLKWGKFGKYNFTTTTTTPFGGLIEETGTTTKKFQDKLICPHKQIISFGPTNDMAPHFNNDTFVAPNAVIVGNVQLMSNSSIWYGCILRGDTCKIDVGQYTNIQDETIITEALNPLGPDHDGSTIIGHYVTIGHKCILRACTIEDQCLVGMGSVLEEGSYMEHLSILGAGSVLAKGARIASGELWLGNPAKFYRKVTAEEIESIYFGARDYWELIAKKHVTEFFLPSTLHREVSKMGIPIGWKDM